MRLWHRVIGAHYSCRAAAGRVKGVINRNHHRHHPEAHTTVCSNMRPIDVDINIDVNATAAVTTAVVPIANHQRQSRWLIIIASH